MNEISIMKKHHQPKFIKIKLLNICALCLFLVLLSVIFSGCQKIKKTGSWNEKNDFIYDMQPIIFHYDHGILAGSYPQKLMNVAWITSFFSTLKWPLV